MSRKDSIKLKQIQTDLEAGIGKAMRAHFELWRCYEAAIGQAINGLTDIWIRLGEHKQDETTQDARADIDRVIEGLKNV